MGRISNLLRIRRFYNLFRDLLEKPKKRTTKNFKELIKLFFELDEVRMAQGYKTYITAVLAAAVTALYALGYIDEETWKALMGFINAGALGTVAAKINRVDRKIAIVDEKIELPRGF